MTRPVPPTGPGLPLTEEDSLLLIYDCKVTQSSTDKRTNPRIQIYLFIIAESTISNCERGGEKTAKENLFFRGGENCLHS